MSSVDYLRQFVGQRLTAAAEEIFGVFHETIVQYEEEIGRQRKLLDVVFTPKIKLRRIELPQHDASEKEGVLVEQQQLWNQERNSSVDQVDTEPLQVKEEQEEVGCSQLGLKQENQDLILISKYEENDQREDQTGPSEASPVKFPFIVSVVSGENSELLQQQLSNNLDGAESQDQNEGKREDLEPKQLNNKHCNSDTNDVGNKTMLKTDSVTGRKSFPCDTCGKYFRHRRYLQKHMLTHTGERPYPCKTCGKTFKSSSGLVIHMRKVHIREKPYICKTCGKGFAYNCDWTQHLRTHTGEKPYVCQTCGKAFSVSSGLMRHQRLHTGERPFICSTCGQTFKFDAELVVHMRRAHTGERPYVCKTCGKHFFTSSNLSAHTRRAHTDKKPHLCKTCGKGFVFSSDLVIHVRRNHTGERPYVCKVCGKGFAASFQLVGHAKRHTDD